MIDLDTMLAEEEESIHNAANNNSDSDEGNDSTEGSTEGSTEDSTDTDSSTNGNSDSDSDDDTVDETAEAYFNYLKEVAVLDVPDDFKFKGNADSIQEALTLTKKNLTAKVAQNIWNSLPDDFKPLLEYGLNRGQNLKDYLEAVKLTDVEALDLGDDISRKAVIKSYYRILSPKLDDAQLDKRVEKLAEIGDLEEEAQDALEYLKTHRQEQKDALVQKAKAEQEAQLETLRKEITDVTALIDSSDEFDINRKNRLKTFLFTPTSQNTTGFEATLDSVYENPQHKIQLANILADYDPKQGFNFEKLQKKLQTKATQSLKELMNSKLDPKTQTKGSSKKADEDFDFSKWFNN